MTDRPNADAVQEDAHALLFGIRRSVRYHVRRRRFFDRLHTGTNALGVLFGSAAIAAILGQLPHVYGIVAAALVTVASALDLVIGTAAMARVHEEFAKRFIALEREMALTSELTADAVRQFTARRLEIEMEEPPVLRTLDRLCHNELLRAMGYGPERLVRVPWYHRWLAQVVDFQDAPQAIGEPARG